MSSSEEFLRDALGYLNEDEEILASIIFTRRREKLDAKMKAHIFLQKDLREYIKLLDGEESYENLRSLLMFISHLVVEVISGLMNKDPEAVNSLRMFIEEMREQIDSLKQFSVDNTMNE